MVAARKGRTKFDRFSCLTFQDPAAAKKPMLKLASFADLGQNGISDSTPMSADECNQVKIKLLVLYFIVLK